MLVNNSPAAIRENIGGSFVFSESLEGVAVAASNVSVKTRTRCTGDYVLLARRSEGNIQAIRYCAFDPFNQLAVRDLKTVPLKYVAKDK